ncbi:MAG: hypothetical protein K0S65_1890, partial [Labilithrix sp.]|nr:hypothetical protein [Labilithrix sp.]
MWSAFREVSRPFRRTFSHGEERYHWQAQVE